MSKKLPYIQFMTGDWIKDPALSLCSATTRGVWIDFICAMHNLDRSGKLTGTIAQLSRIGRCSEREIKTALRELSDSNTANVTVSNGNVTVINRRMYKEAKARNGTRIRVRRSRGKTDDVTVPETASPDISDSISYSDKNSNTKKETPNPLSGELIFPFSESFKENWQEWREYKFSQFKFKYRSPKTEQKALNEIFKISGQVEARAVEIINRSIAQGWKGFFPMEEPKGQVATAGGGHILTTKSPYDRK